MNASQKPEKTVESTRVDFWTAAFARSTIVRAAKVSLVVGSALLVINQGDMILAGRLPPVWKILLTYMVPYAVSTYSAAAARPPS